MVHFAPNCVKVEIEERIRIVVMSLREGAYTHTQLDHLNKTKIHG